MRIKNRTKNLEKKSHCLPGCLAVVLMYEDGRPRMGEAGGGGRGGEAVGGVVPIPGVHTPGSTV